LLLILWLGAINIVRIAIIPYVDRWRIRDIVGTWLF
jgi:hypothetical protein